VPKFVPNGEDFVETSEMVHNTRAADFSAKSGWTEMRMGGLKRGEFLVSDSTQVCAKWSRIRYEVRQGYDGVGVSDLRDEAMDLSK
jgi:hypothetical protein